jgi:hypothetical protein
MNKPTTPADNGQAPVPVGSGDLLGCPWCGAEPKLSADFSLRLMSDTARISCACGAQSPLFSHFEDCKSEAIKWWNTRKQPNEKS